MNIERKARPELISVRRMEEAARVMCRSGEALFGYYKQLDALNDANLSREALVERARDAERQARLMLSAGLDALNELHDVGLLNTMFSDEHLNNFNQRNLTEATRELVGLLNQRLPNERWDWLLEGSELVKDVKMRVEREGNYLRSTVIAPRERTRTLFLDPSASGTRVSTEAFFSDGLDRVYMPTSGVLWNSQDLSEPVAPYDAMIGGWAFAREWMYRHVRYVTELGPPSRGGGGPALAVLAVVLFCVGVAAAVAAVITAIICMAEGFESKACALSGFFTTAAGAMGYGSAYADNKAKQFQYGTNPQ
jgi:hypothetical protein